MTLEDHHGLVQLRRFLSEQQPGEVSNVDRRRIVELLGECWDSLTDSSDGAMRHDKLSGRTENMRWEPPNLRFEIERHAGSQNGSSRADVQFWAVDVNRAGACLEKTSYRQIAPRQPRLKVGPIAEETCRRIVHGEDHPSLKWSDDRMRVLVRIAELIPDDSFKETVTGRRKRFRGILEPRLEESGWYPAEGTRPNTYDKCDVNG